MTSVVLPRVHKHLSTAEHEPLTANYQSAVYKKKPQSYHPEVVWQFWGRAAEASWTEKSGALFYCRVVLRILIAKVMLMRAV